MGPLATGAPLPVIGPLMVTLPVTQTTPVISSPLGLPTARLPAILPCTRLPLLTFSVTPAGVQVPPGGDHLLEHQRDDRQLHRHAHPLRHQDAAARDGRRTGDGPPLELARDGPDRDRNRPGAEKPVGEPGVTAGCLELQNGLV